MKTIKQRANVRRVWSEGIGLAVVREGPWKQMAQAAEPDQARPFWAMEEVQGAGTEWVWEEWQEMNSGGSGGQKSAALGAKLPRLNVL